jgi:hypothetical protein
MSVEPESILIALAVIGPIMLLGWLFSKRKHRPKTPGSHRIAGESSPLPFAMPTEGAERMPAAEMLSRLQLLRSGSAQWDAILSELNPHDDPEVQRLLTEIRGPHMFAPHVGLSVMEEACKRVLAISPNADTLEVLRQAVRSQEPFVR